MKSILLGFAILSTVGLGAPATAQAPNRADQGEDRSYGGGTIADRIERLGARIETGVQNGTITRQQARPLRQQHRQLVQLERQYSANGLSGQERADLQQRVRDLRQQLRVADRGGEGRYSDWEQWDREGGSNQNNRFGDRAGGNDDGRYDRDRDDRWDDDAQDGEYQEPAQRGALGGIIDNLFGTRGVRVGEQAPGNLGSVPYEYRNQYRDGNGVYYRSDGRAIYEIDARNRTVLRAYPMNR